MWLMALIFLVAFFEAFAIVGVVVPGVVLLFALSLAIGFDLGLFFSAWLAASAGAFCGDAISFWLGRRWQPSPMATRYGDLLDRSRALFQQHGGKSIFIGRFVGPIRPVIPLVGGMLGTPWRSFLAFGVPACILWAPVYLLPGVIFGASLELAAAMAGRLAVLMVLLVIGVWLVLWVVQLVYRIASRKSSWWIKRFVLWSNRHPYFGPLVGGIFRPGSREVVGIVFLGITLALSLTALLVLLVLAPQFLPQWSEAFHPATWASSLRNQWADPIMVVLSLFGDQWVMLTLTMGMAGVMALTGRWLGAGHWLVLVGGVWGLAFGIDALTDWLMDLPTPDAIAHESLMQVPHRGLSVLTSVLMFFALVVAKDLNARSRKWPYLIAALFVALIFFAHFYLELASLLGMAAALALGLSWTALVGIGYRHRANVHSFPMRLVGIFVVLWAGLSMHHINDEAAARLAASEVPVQTRVVSASQWQENEWRELPLMRSLLGDEISRYFDFQLVGSIDEIESTLARQGWQRAPKLSWRSVMEGFGGRPAHWPRALNGQAEALFMVRDDAHYPHRQVLRLWTSGLSVESNGQTQPLWLGQVRAVSIESGFLGLRRFTDLRDDRPVDELEQALEAFGFIRVRPLWTAPTP